MASPVWFKFVAGMPSAMIWDMQIDRGATTLSLWTRSRGAYVWQLPTAPTAVTFASTRAQRTSRGVLVRWRTAQEAQLLGFNVYREVGAKRVRVNGLVPPTGGASVTGHAYSFLDRRAAKNGKLRYWVQAVALDGSRIWKGPIATAR